VDFGALPPEINSARMYCGPGSGPMLTAAAAWDVLATQLHWTATDYASVISGMTAGPWMGPGSESMAAAAARYTAWMSSTAAHIEQTAHQARAAAAVFEAAFVQTVPPPAIAANRSLLMALIATNVLGQNGAAIAATEAQYGEMWAQDAAAMYGYAGSSAAATTLTPFTPPQPTTNPAGLAAQGAAVAQATGTSITTDTQATSSALTATIPNALQQLSVPISPPSSSSTSASTLLSALSSTVSTSSAGIFSSSSLLQIAKAFAPALSAVGQDVGLPGLALPAGLGAGAGAFGSAGLGVGGAATAGLGQAASLGALSVPQSWAATSTPLLSSAPAVPSTALGASTEVTGGGPPGLLGGLPSAAMAGRGATAVVPDARFLERPPMLPSWSTRI
jgi:PPE-repeat protein